MEKRSRAEVKENLLKEINSLIKIYDNGGKSFDRITIAYVKEKDKHTGLYPCIAASESGTGFYLHVECMLGRHLGKRVKYEELNPELQKTVLAELLNYQYI